MKTTDSTRVVAIAALAKDSRVIGKDGDIPWSIPADMKRFKVLTIGHPVIMGRKTWESLSEAVRPLPGRENIILTRQAEYKATGAVVTHTAEEALQHARHWAREHRAEEIFVIGGEQIYRTLLPQTDQLYLTLVDTNVDGDAFFPEYEEEFPHALESEIHRDHDPRYSFVTRIRSNT